MTPDTTNATAVAHAKNLRVALDTMEKQVREHADYIKQNEFGPEADKGEMIAQAMLALRATEEARMRLGKVIQYAEGGQSVYDAANTEAVDGESSAG